LRVTDPSYLLHFGGLTYVSILTRTVNDVQSDEIYELAAQSNDAIRFHNIEESYGL